MQIHVKTEKTRSYISYISVLHLVPQHNTVSIFLIVGHQLSILPSSYKYLETEKRQNDSSETEQFETSLVILSLKLWICYV